MNRLKELREEQGYSLQDLSDKLMEDYNIKVGRASLNNYERGVQNPKQVVWEALAEILHVTVPYIMGLSSARNKVENTMYEQSVSDLVDLVNENGENSVLIRKMISALSIYSKVNMNNRDKLEPFSKILNEMIRLSSVVDSFIFDNQGNQVEYTESIQNVLNSARDIESNINILVDIAVSELDFEKYNQIHIDVKSLFSDEEINEIRKEYTYEDFQEDEEKRQKLSKEIEDRVNANFKRINQGRTKL